MGNISGVGISQADLVTFLTHINTKLTALLTKLDADGTVAATDYVSTCAVTFPSSTITSNGVSQGAIVDFLDDWITGYNAALAKVDADAGAGIDDNYVSLCGVTDIVNATTNPAKGLYNNGMRQGDMIALLQTIVTKFNTALAKLDTDPLTDSNYAATCAITDTVDNTAC
jgi:hypothetical protein